MRDDAELEILSYRAFCNRQVLEAWQERRRAYERKHSSQHDPDLGDDERVEVRGYAVTARPPSVRV